MQDGGNCEGDFGVCVDGVSGETEAVGDDWGVVEGPRDEVLCFLWGSDSCCSLWESLDATLSRATQRCPQVEFPWGRRS
jgi:hypothetical protein